MPQHHRDAIEAVVMSLLLFREWPQAAAGWSTQFMLDSEWNWPKASHRSTISDGARCQR